MDFSIRSDAKEIMDGPGLEKESIKKAYIDINRCNTFLGGDAITINGVKALIQKHPKVSYTIYDMGCGDGHMLRKLSEVFKNDGIELHLVGIDLTEDILELGREACEAYGNISFKKADILELDDLESCDILLCTLTMHHFSENEILQFSKRFSKLAQLGVVINDLQRSRLAHFLFRIFGFFFMTSRIAKEDGLTSIQRGFRKSDLTRMANKLKQVHHTIQWKWAFRYVWIMEPARQT